MIFTFLEPIIFEYIRKVLLSNGHECSVLAAVMLGGILSESISTHKRKVKAQ